MQNTYSLITSLSGWIRIIGGKWRGRTLPVINKPGLRPTTSRMRETIFHWLNPVIKGARCLDCFAGSGILGLEALSRFAASITFLELKSTVAQQLKRNIVRINGKGKVIHTNTLTWLSGKGESFNIIFLDPPFCSGLLEKTIFLLEKKWCSEKAWVYIETEVKNTAPILRTNWNLYREKTSGKIISRIYIFHSNK